MVTFVGHSIHFFITYISLIYIQTCEFVALFLIHLLVSRRDVLVRSGTVVFSCRTWDSLHVYSLIRSSSFPASCELVLS